MDYYIENTWDGKPVNHKSIKVTLSEAQDGNLKLTVSAPFFNSPAKPDGPVGEPFPKLWDYEVVEAFFLNGMDQYLEVELSPHGQHLVLLLNGRRNMVKQLLPLDFKASIDGDHWTGEAIIPLDYLPSAFTKFNAYAIHGEGEERQYESLYPVWDVKPEMQPDFHRLEQFQPLEMNKILSKYDPTTVSKTWKQVLCM